MGKISNIKVLDDNNILCKKLMEIVGRIETLEGATKEK
jgi:hypothetical protein